tara:strand:+ start:404 stop:1411 length:1008 start_codon:yes stop_codon:yes gene_type:complete
MRLSVLDQSTAATGKQEDQAIRDTIKLAQNCETMGYYRFWVSEHHNHPAIVGTAPEIVMAAIGQSTKHIRIGSAGIMLPHYAPLKVAEQFRVLEAIAPGRIDLGLGRAPGSDGRTAYALNPNAQEDSEQFPANVRDLIAWVSNTPLIENHPFHNLKARPSGASYPEIWMLGTSDYGAQVAAHFGIPYCFAHFITDGRGVERALDLYRTLYKPSKRFPKPIATICVWALAADTTEDAEHLFASRMHWKYKRENGELTAIDDPEKIVGFAYSDADKLRLKQFRESAIFGDVARVADQILDLAKTYNIDEIVILTWTHDQADRLRSYELLADAFSLTS